MKILFWLIISLLSFENTVTLKSTISPKGLYIYTSPYIIKDSRNNMNYLLTFFYDDNIGYFKIYDSKEKEVFSKIIATRAMNRYLCFFYKNIFYFFSEKLYRMDISKMTLDSVSLKSSDYLSIGLLNLNNQIILNTKSANKIDLYDFKNLSYLKTIESNYGKQDIIRNCNSTLIYRNSDNELAAYDINKNKIIWKINTGKADAKLLGVTLGSFNNFITSYLVIDGGNENYLYMTTVNGDLYKLDPLSGKVLIKKEHFRGDDNNSGLITDLQFADVNGDGISDLIGPSVDYNIYCLDGRNLSVLWQYDTGYENQSPVTLKDVNNDGIPEVFNINDKMTLTVLNGKNGECKLSYKIEDEKNQTRPLVDYYYQNKNLNVIVKANDNEIRIYEINAL